MTDNATRTALSAALAGATAEQLREDAARMLRYDADSAYLSDEFAEGLRRLAALALAVAELEEADGWAKFGDCGHDGCGEDHIAELAAIVRRGGA